MSEAIDDGGPAFPLPAHSGAIGEQSYPIYGMTLRDWFAGQALAGVIFANAKTDSELIDMMKAEDAKQKFEFIPKACAESAYKYADAMLAARKEKQ